MSEEERIDYLNHRIIILNRKIKNINTRDDIIGILSGFLIFSGINIGYIYNLSGYDDSCLYSVVMLCSIGLGMVPGISLPTYKTMKKVALYQMEIKKSIDELHQFALEEDKKMVKIKKMPK